MFPRGVRCQFRDSSDPGRYAVADGGKALQGVHGVGSHIFCKHSSLFLSSACLPVNSVFEVWVGSGRVAGGA